MSKTKTKSIFFFIFAISGFSGIIYESIWTHYLKLFLGHAAYAQTLVLAIFMGGMAIGAWVCSLYSVRWRNLLLAYALAEGIIGISALFFHPLFDHFINLAYSDIIPQIASPFAVQLFKWTFSSLLILPQSILLGMTFPLMSAAIIRNFPDSPGGTISMLYFTNSFGAAIGILMSGFVLIGWIGLPGTIVTAGLINLSLAIVVWRFAYKQGPEREFCIVKEESPLYAGKSWFFCFLTISFMTGLASFIYEIGWIRMLSLVLSSSTHSFELMLSSFIFGLAFGGLWIKKRIDKISKPVRFLALVQLAMGAMALITLPLYGNTFNLMRWLVENLNKTETGYFLFNLSSHGIALMVMLPATFCAGMTLPLITHILLKQGHGERSIGAVYTANTLGAITGIFFAVHIGMPAFGLKGLITAGAAIDIFLALFLMWFLCGYSSRRIPLAYSLTSAALVLLIFFGVKLDLHKMASGVYRHAKILDPSQNKVLLHRDGKTASISMIERGGKRNIRTNGKIDATISMNPSTPYGPDEPTMILAAAVPMLLNPTAKKVANIGLGSGLTTHALLTNPFLERVDTIEIEQAMVDLARGFLPRNELAYTDPRSKMHIDDAKTFFSAYNKKYDIIISEPSNPWVSGVSGLFSEEFYPLVKRHLTDKGLLVQWLQLYEIDTELVASVIKALSKSFADYDVFATNYGDILIIAAKDGVIPSLSPNLFKVPSFAKELGKVDIYGIQDVELRRIGGKKLFYPFFSSYKIKANSDYYPILDLNAAKTRFLGLNAQNLIALASEPIPLLELMGVKALSLGKTTINPSPLFPKSELVYNAMLMRDYIAYGKNKLKAKKDAATLMHAQNFIKLLKKCSPETIRGERISTIFNVSKRIVAYLTPSELNAIWDSVENTDCEELNDLEKTWISFFKAVGNRDNKKIIVLVQQLLQKDRYISESRLKYLVAAGVTSNLAENNRTEAYALLSKNKTFLNQKQQSLLFPLLLSLASPPA